MTSPAARRSTPRPDALAALLPAGREAALAAVLTEEDRATLRHIAAKGMGANTLRALGSDLGYLEAWAQAATGLPLPWPADEALVLKFVAQHLWDPEERARSPQHGMPAEVAEALRRGGFLRKRGPHAPATVQRRLASWSTLTAWRDLDGPFGSPALRRALRLAVRAQDRPRQRKSAEAVTAEVLRPVLAQLDALAATPVDPRDPGSAARHLLALRDRALLSLGFAAGGRRRSELAGLRMGQITSLPPVPLPSPGEEGESPALRLRLGRTKTTSAEDDAAVTVTGRAVRDLAAWTEAAAIRRGPVFRRIDRWGHLGKLPLTPEAVNLILKRRLAEAGHDPARFSAHGLRSGFMTEAALQGLSLPEAMHQSGHRSVQQASAYFQGATDGTTRGARLLE